MRRQLAVTALVVATSAGCATAGGPEPSGPAASDGSVFVPRVYAFEVVGSDGTSYDHPFLGGLNVPRPQWIDIDGDGDLDLFVQEVSGEVMFFERVATEGPGQYALRARVFEGLDVGEWYRFGDVDADGDFDLLAEERFSYIRLFRNVGSPTSVQLELAIDSLRDTEGGALFSDRQNIPNVNDIDCDGRLDLLIGRLVGTISHYEAVGPGAQAGSIPRFRHLTDRFEDIEIVAQLGGSRHGANTLALTDIDQDGDLDLFWGDFFEAGLLFLENRGSCEAPSLTGEPVNFPLNEPIATSGYNAPTFGDFDGDGDEDLLVGVLGGAFNANRTVADNLYYLEQLDDMAFQVRTRRFLSQVDVGSESIPSLADLDGDGDLDLYLANKIDPANQNSSVVYRFRNDGDATSPRFVFDGSTEWTGKYHLMPAFADLDADGDLDAMLGSWEKNVAFYRNNGSATEPSFVLVDEAAAVLTRGTNTTPALVDIDADGDLDLFVGEASGTLNYYRNDGTATAPAFALVSDEYDGIDVGRRSFPAFLDVDGDEDFDMILGSDSGPLMLYRNEGSAQVPAFTLDEAFVVPAPPYSAPAFADLDADGDLDLLAGGIGGGLRYFENVGSR